MSPKRSRTQDQEVEGDRPDEAQLDREVFDNEQVRVNLHALKRDVVELRLALGTVLGLEGISRVVGHGFSEVIAELLPLRDLIRRPPFEKLTEGQTEILAALSDALVRPDWSGIGRLDVREVDLGYIPHQPPPDQQHSNQTLDRTGTKP